MRLIPILIVFTATLAFVYSTEVRACKGQRKLDSDSVSITKCRKPPCKLRKGSNAEITLNFTPESEIKRLTTKVSGIILGVPFPFIGVDGTSACNNVFETDGTTKASCPLKAGTEYIYKNSFPVLELYPNVDVIVHWALHDEDAKRDAACFQVPSKIV